jgi:hypothetical protein
MRHFVKSQHGQPLPINYVSTGEPYPTPRDDEFSTPWPEVMPKPKCAHRQMLANLTSPLAMCRPCRSVMNTCHCCCCVRPRCSGVASTLSAPSRITGMKLVALETPTTSPHSPHQVWPHPHLPHVRPPRNARHMDDAVVLMMIGREEHRSADGIAGYFSEGQCKMRRKPLRLCGTIGHFTSQLRCNRAVRRTRLSRGVRLRAGVAGDHGCASSST